MNSHPYEKYEDTLIWNTVNSAIALLIENGDLLEITRREYIVGYIVESLDKRSCLKNEVKFKTTLD